MEYLSFPSDIVGLVFESHRLLKAPNPRPILTAYHCVASAPPLVTFTPSRTVIGYPALQVFMNGGR